MSLSRKAPRFLLAGNSPYANRGCEAIVRGTVELLSSRFPGASFVLSSFGASTREEAAAETDPRIEHRPHVDPYLPPRRFSRQWLTQTLRRRGPHQMDTRPYGVETDAMAECDCALVLGGDTLTLEYGTADTYVGLNNALMSSGKPVILWGASVGPFTADPQFEAAMTDHLRRFTLVLARESATIEYLASIGVEENVRLVADPAFAMRPSEPDLPDDLREFVDEGPFGLNFSPLAGRYRPEGDRGWPELIAECIVRLMESGVSPVLLVPHVTIDTDYDNDYRFLMRIGQGLPGWGETVRALPPTLSAAETKWVISRTRAFAGARMHATLASLSAHVPTIFLGYSLKYRGIARDVFGHQDWLIPVDSLAPGTLADRFAELLREQDNVRRALAAVMPEVLRRAEDAADYAAEAMSRGGGANAAG